MPRQRQVRRRAPKPALRPGAEPLEAKILQASRLAANGVDALALGDVNGDRVVDLFVAGRQGGVPTITIYDGVGAKDTSTTTGAGVLPLATITNPLGKNPGPLSIAVGDFNGDGLSELAVSAATRNGKGSAKVKTYRFELPAGALPLGTPVKAVVLSDAFVPQGIASPSLSLASGDVNGDGQAELAVASSSARTLSVSVFGFVQGAGWQSAGKLSLPAVAKKGVSLGSGDVTGDGIVDLAAIDQSTGRVSVLDGSSGKWSGGITPLKGSAAGSRVAVVANENAPGALVVTSAATRNPTAALVEWSSGSIKSVRPVTSPGTGALVAAGGGWVYQRSTLSVVGGFAVTDKPNTPTVLFGATGGQSVVVQGFDARLAPSKADTTVEPVLGKATAGVAFTSLQAPDNFSETGESKIDVAPLVAFPKLAYTSPYSVDLSKLPASIYEGLWSADAITSATTDRWGPSRVANTPPTIPGQDTTNWLQGRILAAYSTFLGKASYQHHYDPRWSPTQGSPWNAVTQGFQDPGIDCTNFTAFAYDDALGITMNSLTSAQAAITSNADIQIPDSIKDHVQVQVLGPWTSYDAMVNDLQPGDILYINPSQNTMAPGYASDPSKVTHAITWLGNFGVGATGAGQHLIIDSTVDNPPHIDANNRIIPTGVHIRPFNPPTDPTNNWYAGHVDHALRIIKT